MANLAQLTDTYQQEPDVVNNLPVEQPDIIIGGNGVPTRITVRPEVSSVGSKVDKILNSLFRDDDKRYQLWPEKVIRGGLTAAGDVLAGNVPQWAVDNETGDVHTSPQMIEKAQEISALAGTGGLAGGAEGTALNATPSLRPALKYKDKIYKGKEGQQHQDVIPKELYPEFEQMAMNGEDISHYNFGFMNHKGQFLDREKALEYAINEGLVDAHAGQYGALTSTLMADSSKPGTAIEAMKANPFYSAVERNVKAIPQNKMTGDQWLGTLSNKPGVKPEELQWTGVKDFLEENKGKAVTKAQIEEHLANNKVELKEVDKGKGKLDKAVKAFENETTNGIMVNGEKVYSNEVMPWLLNGDLKVSELPTNLQSMAKDILREHGNVEPTKYHSYQLPGGENYREKLLTTPVKTSLKTQEGLALTKRMNDGEFNSLNDADRKALFNKRDILLREGKTEEGTSYKSSHWDEPNILAHVRMNDRNIDGKKSLHLEEIQSDWHQQGREKGYASDVKIPDRSVLEKQMKEIRDRAPSNLDNMGQLRWLENQPEYVKLRTEFNNQVPRNFADTVPDAPFKKSWHELALKRMIREAAEKGYDRLSWTPGEAQAARYDLSKQVDHIKYNPKSKNLAAYDKNGNQVIDKRDVTHDNLADYIGKEAAEKIKNTKAKGEYITLENTDLKVGGEGMKGFYDQIIPKTLEKLGKEHGVKVKQTHLDDAIKEYPKSNEFGVMIGGKEHYFKSKEEAQKVVEKIHYIDLPQSLKDQAMRGFPLFSSGIPIDLLDNKK